MMPQNQPLSRVSVSEYDPIQLRYEKGWTLQELADRLGVSIDTTKKWSSHRRNPSKLARHLAARLL